MKMYLKKISIALCIILTMSIAFTGCDFKKSQSETRTIVDQVGRSVEIPIKIERVAALHWFAAKGIFALGQQDKLVHKSIKGKEAKALAAIDSNFGKLPEIERTNGKKVNPESLLNLKPQIVFTYASFGTEDIEKFEAAGLTVVGLKGETLEEAFEGINLLGEILNCPEEAKNYIDYVKNQYNYITEKTKDIPETEKPKVLITGPKSIYAVATGEMLQNEMVEVAGGINVANALKGRWAEVSPEQIVEWNPDYILLGSSFGSNTIEDIYNNEAFSTINAVKNKNIYVFPSNIGWWDFPLPQAILGMLWTAKTINPQHFEELDMQKVADDYYKKYMGHTFTELGGKLDNNVKKSK